MLFLPPFLISAVSGLISKHLAFSCLFLFLRHAVLLAGYNSEFDLLAGLFAIHLGNDTVTLRKAS